MSLRPRIGDSGKHQRHRSAIHNLGIPEPSHHPSIAQSVSSSLRYVGDTLVEDEYVLHATIYRCRTDALP